MRIYVLIVFGFLSCAICTAQTDTLSSPPSAEPKAVEVVEYDGLFSVIGYFGGKAWDYVAGDDDKKKEKRKVKLKIIGLELERIENKDD